MALVTTISSHGKGNARPETPDAKKPWGHTFNQKHKNTIRLLSCDINGFPATTNDTKNIQIKEFLKRNNIHITMFQEMNRFWKKCHHKNQVSSRTKGWFEAFNHSTGYYRDYPNCKGGHQQGGTSVWAIDKMAHRVGTKGSDHLGRWSWVKFRGKGEIVVRVISAYRPLDSKEYTKSVYNQHKHYFLNNNNPNCPRTIFVSDLMKEITQWTNDGEQIVLEIDVNEGIHTCDLTRQLQRIGIEEACTQAHGKGGPPT